MAISKKRLALIHELEQIIGGSCYNGNIQNWGRGGTYEGEGRTYRYPVRFTMPDGKPVRSGASDLPPDVQMTGHYAFGANSLGIMKALDKVLAHLEANHSLKI